MRKIKIQHRRLVDGFIIFLITAGALVLAPSAQAADFTIADGETAASTQNLDGDDKGTVDEGGAITISGDDGTGIYSTGDNNQIDNNGTITMQGASGTTGVWVRGNETTVTNNEAITMEGTGTGINALYSEGTGNTAVNTGMITHAGERSSAVWGFSETTNGMDGKITTEGKDSPAMGSNVNSATLTNNGNLETSGENAYGIYANDDSDGTANKNTIITNSNSISTTGKLGHGISSGGDYTKVTNSGAISTGETVENSDGTTTVTGESAYGIFAKGANAEIEVTSGGTITTAGDNAHGIRTNGDGATVFHSGTITAAGDTVYGIYSEAPATITTKEGSKISLSGTGVSGIYSSFGKAVIEHGGEISLSGTGFTGLRNGVNRNQPNIGIAARGNDAKITITITSSGTILSTSTSGTDVHGIRTYGSGTANDNIQITNNGTITMSGTKDTKGVYVGGNNTTVTNNNAITMGGTGTGINALYSGGTGNTAVNNGTITHAGADAAAVQGFLKTENKENGTITTTGNDSSAMGSDVNSATLTNNGSLTTQGENAHGIYAEGVNTDIASSGTIATTGDGAHGIHLNNTGTITHSGAISATGEGSFAILGSDDHAQKVNIEIGAEVTGTINLGTGKGDTMNNGDGDVVTIDMMSSSIAAAYSITGAEKINTLVGGEKVMLPTLSGFAGLMVLSDEAMTGFATGRAALRWTTGHIHRLVARQMAAPERLAEGADAGAPVRETWGLLLGGRAERNESGLAAWKHGLDGAVIGHSAPLPGGWRGGLFAGLGFGRTETVKSDSFREDIDRVFVGAHGRRRLGDFAIGGSLLVGNAAHDGARAVNNMSNGVRETAVGAYDGFWFSPSLAVEWSHGLGNGFVLRPSARISYAREAQDGYTESGASSANLIVKGRAVDVVDGRLQLELSKSFAAGRGWGAGRVGGSFADYGDDRYTASLAGGDATTFDVPGDSKVKGGYAGFSVRYAIEERVAVAGDVEYAAASGGEKSISGRLGLEFSF